jgi:hypothetical protein
MLIAGVFPDMSLKATYSLFTSFLEGAFRKFSKDGTLASPYGPWTGAPPTGTILAVGQAGRRV